MSDFYGTGSRTLQDKFDTRRLADRETKLIIHNAVTDEDRAFIESRDMFFLATVDREGRPQCSYKGGAPGFARVGGVFVSDTVHRNVWLAESPLEL